MTLLKDERTVRLDDVGRAAEEATALYEDLVGRIETASLRALVAAHIDAQRQLTERIAEQRRRAGQLPQGGDPERAHLHAAGALLRAAALPGATTEHFAESMLAAAESLSVELAHALELALPAELTEPLRALDAENERFRAALLDAGA